MSPASEGIGTEHVTDSRNQHPLYNYPRDSHSRLQYLLERQKPDGIPLLRVAPQIQPNEQFYCTNNGLANYTDNNKFRQREEVEDENHSLPTRQEAEVAAAARFISKVDIVIIDTTNSSVFQIPPRPRLGSSTTVRDSIFDAPPKALRTNSAHLQMGFPVLKRREVARPPPLQLRDTGLGTGELPSPLPARTSSKGAPCFDTARPPDSAKLSARSVTSPGLMFEPKTPLAILTPESANTFHFDFAFPTEPSLSRSASDATTNLQSPQTPDTELADEELQPIEDQVRKDIEAFALEQGPYLRSSQRRTRKPAIVDDQGDNQDSLPSLPATPPALKEERGGTTGHIEMTQDDEEALGSATLRRKKSIFGWLQKRTEVEVDELIDLYLSEDQKEEIKSVKRKASRSKIDIFRNRVTTDPLPMNGG